MITKDNLKKLLTCLGFQKTDSVQDEMNIHFDKPNCSLTVDFSNEKIFYPEGIEADRDTTKNFSANENFVVLECVVGLLAQGYKPENIVLEPKTPGGREDSHFYCDILIRDNELRPYMLIECKTMDGKEDDEFNKAWKKTLQDGGQLFNYYNTYRQAQYLALYASDFVEGEPRCNYRLITMTDNKDYLDSNPKLLSFEKVSIDNGTRDDFFRVWKETYGQDYATNGAFEVDEVPAFGVTKKKMTIDDLIIVDGQDIQRKYHQFAQTLRQYNVASHENAFDKLVNLFLVKVVDEVRNPLDLQFLWKGAAYDDYYSFQDRLQRLYQIGMKDYLGEDVTYIDNASIENAFRMQRNDPDAIKETILEYFRQLKFYSNSDFGFLDVHNKQLFVQNAVILKAMVEMLQDMRLKTDQQNQFLGDLFEGFLDQGVKQNEGQFFTPTPITRFMVSSLPLEKIISESTDIPKAIDYACGAGHFLNEYASQIKPFVEKYKGAQSLPDYYKQIYGIEKEYRLSKVSKVSSFMYGQDGIQIVYGDALIPHAQIKDSEYNVLVANPPYSVTGFLATLTKEQRQAYLLSAEVDDKALETNNSIEAFFIERAKQMLAPNGVATIILPSSILFKVENIYVKTREILLQYFDFVAIAEFGSGTFGKTGTNTVVLFLRRKESEPELASHYRNRVNSWFSNNHSQDHRFEDFDIINRYANHIGVKYEDYLTLVNGNPSDKLFENRIFKTYREEFSNDSDAKKIKKKKITAKYTASHMEQELEKYIVNSIRVREQEKLYYYMLCESNPQPVVIVKSPTDKDKKAIKNFLGYEWSGRKGNEGIKYIGSTLIDEDDNITANKGIQHINTPLFDPQDLSNESKINSIIRNNYMLSEIDIPDELVDYVSILNLSDMIDFSKTVFDKSIKTAEEKKILVESKYPVAPLKDFAEIQKGKSITSAECKPGIIKVVAGGKDFATYHNESNRPKGTITVSASGAYAGFVNYWDEPIFASDCSTLIANKKISQQYLYEYLKSIQDKLYYLQKGAAQPHVYPKDLADVPIVCAPTEIQNKIASECATIDIERTDALTKLNDLMQTFTDKLGQLTLPGEGRNECKLGDVCSITSTLVDPTAEMYRDLYHVGGANLESKTGEIINLKSAKEEGLISGKYLFYKDMVLYNKIRPYLVKVARPDFKGLCSADMYPLTPTNALLKDYLYYLLITEHFTSYAIACSSRAGMPKVNRDSLFAYRVHIPSLDIQKNIVKDLNNINSQLIDCRKLIGQCDIKKIEIVKKYLQ